MRMRGSASASVGPRGVASDAREIEQARSPRSGYARARGSRRPTDSREGSLPRVHGRRLDLVDAGGGGEGKWIVCRECIGTGRVDQKGRKRLKPEDPAA